ncbi:MAG TPA: threonine synthase [Candidatus Ornithospirochaeta avicola]|uniref:Threonine synthase n=1 Tax=Candidatus Ornithospirochaeta avicola TaxID=2840896 RepID=A0A9D1TP73_9SPIO|nr:threonine synthase [Candidatus Ornithospirochaeta avicola]
MRFYSTRDKEKKLVSASDALLMGLAEDGGLFVPEYFPSIDFSSLDFSSYASVASSVLYPFFSEDIDEDEMKRICISAFNFPVPTRRDGGADTLELIYGPTSAFKDFGARFLSSCMEYILKKRGEKRTVLVATSGDTGGAVASAFFKKENIEVRVLFPLSRVSERQQAQLTTWGENIKSYAVRGSFDDCQKMVKDAFMDESIEGLTSANSINIARLLPQCVYYVYSSYLYFLTYNEMPVFIIPSGNVGNATACYWAKKMGSPIKSITLALNSNRTVLDYLESGVYKKRASIATLANAMDVGAPSNIERLFDLFSDYEEFKNNVSAYSVSDDEIRDTIKREWDEKRHAICPHTACGEYVRRKYLAGLPSIVVATAHPAKFYDIVEPIIGNAVAIPENLFRMLEKKQEYSVIDASYTLLF